MSVWVIFCSIANYFLSTSLLHLILAILSLLFHDSKSDFFSSSLSIRHEYQLIGSIYLHYWAVRVLVLVSEPGFEEDLPRLVLNPFAIEASSWGWSGTKYTANCCSKSSSAIEFTSQTPSPILWIWIRMIRTRKSCCEVSQKFLVRSKSSFCYKKIVL